MFSTTLLIDVLDIRLKMMINTAVVNELTTAFLLPWLITIIRL